MKYFIIKYGCVNKYFATNYNWLQFLKNSGMIFNLYSLLNLINLSLAVCFLLWNQPLTFIKSPVYIVKRYLFLRFVQKFLVPRTNKTQKLNRTERHFSEGRKGKGVF